MENDVTSTPVVDESPVVEINLDAPVEGTEAQKPEDPAPAAEEQKTEESDEQKEARKQSRRERARAKSAAELAEARTEARMLKERLDRLEQRPPEVAPEPKRESFDSLEEYLEARADYRATQTAQKMIETDRTTRAESEKKLRAKDDYERTAKDWTTREEAFMKEAKDYADVIGPFIDSRTGELNDLSQAAKDAITESPLGPQLLYRLALDDAAEAERIARLSPTRQVIEIGKLEDKVIPPKKQSSAPAPVSSVKGSSVTHNITGNETQAEYEAKRKKMGARWAR